jgi:hypothetical protein
VGPFPQGHAGRAARGPPAPLLLPPPVSVITWWWHTTTGLHVGSAAPAPAQRIGEKKGGVPPLTCTLAPVAAPLRWWTGWWDALTRVAPRCHHQHQAAERRAVPRQYARPPAPNSQHPLGVPCHHWFVSRKEIVIVVVYLCVFLVSIVTRTFRFRKKERERENIRMVSGRVQGKIFFGFIRNRWEKKYRRSGDLYDWASHGTRRVVRA